jgi:hypothetical protein
MAALSSYSVATPAFIGSNDFVGSPFIDVGPNYVYIYNMQLPNNGLIYVIIGNICFNFRGYNIMGQRSHR